MFFRSLRAIDFRNLKDLRTEFSSRLNILIGDNGQGKTNVLEALHLATQGQSFRQGDFQTFIREGRSEAFLDVHLDRKELDFRVQAHLTRSRKVLSLNEKRVTSPEIRKLFPVILFSPESLAAIKGGADLRRSLVDEFLVTHHPENANLIADFRKVLKARNQILRQLREAEGSSRQLRDVLESLNPRYFHVAGKLTEARGAALRAIAPEIKNAFGYISTKTDVDISVEMVVSDQRALQWNRSQIDSALRHRARELNDAEIASGVSLVGPHKHEIVFLYHQKDSRFFCSQGQQRALILAFKMAQIVYHRKAYGFYPVLMLDDVLSELDSAKRKTLIAFLHEINTQVFLTTTDLALPDSFELEDSVVMRIANGDIQRER